MAAQGTNTAPAQIRMILLGCVLATILSQVLFSTSPIHENPSVECDYPTLVENRFQVRNQTSSIPASNEKLRLSTLLIANQTLEQKTSSKPKNLWTYRLEPDAFSKQYASCLLDPYCHTLYLHIQKTGGTSVEQVLTKVHGYGAFHPCCDNKLINNFKSKPDQFCNASFQSYQVLPNKFPYLLDTCQEIYDASPLPHRMQILVSVREPISRTLSFIHQQCNRNPNRRSKELLAACDRCNFDSDKDIWLDFAYRTNQEYEDVYTLMSSRVIQEGDKTYQIAKDLPVLAIDLDDLNPFFDHVQKFLPEEYQIRFRRKKSFNKETLERCSFHMSSEMIKVLSKSTKSYRNLTIGVEELF